MVTIEEMVAKRKLRWQEGRGIEYDAQLVSVIADNILDTPELVAQVRAKPYLLIECCFSLVDKNKRNVPFFLNDVQKDFIAQTERLGRSKPYFVLISFFCSRRVSQKEREYELVAYRTFQKRRFAFT